MPGRRGGKPNGYFPTPAGGSRDAWPPTRPSHHRDRSKKGRRQSSSSSSSSKGKATARKVRRASSYLHRHDPEYQRYVEEQKKTSEGEQLRTQGEVLASALKASFDESIRS
eukprot:1568501-Amphidinium_carterae.1